MFGRLLGIETARRLEVDCITLDGSHGSICLAVGSTDCWLWRWLGGGYHDLEKAAMRACRLILCRGRQGLPRSHL